VEEDEVEQVTCEGCGTEVALDDSLTTSDGEHVCNDCYYMCTRCDYSGTDQYNWYYVEDTRWCEDCYQNNAFTCERCDNSYNSDGTSQYEVDNSEWWCEYCAQDRANFCDECEVCYTDECFGCDNRQDGRVHNYQYKPNPVFHGKDKNNLFMGFELEMELNSIDSNEYHEAARLVQPLEADNICYLKADGSIRGMGFELVTHPHSLTAYEQATELWDYIHTLRTEYKARSYDTDSCGLHVHVSRSAFKSYAHTHRFLSLIYRNPREMMKLAGRKNSRYAQFGDVYKPDEWGVPRFTIRDKIHAGSMTERYSAVNTNNDYTLELRFFRGNMKREGIMSALELCHASVEYTRDLNLSDVKLGALKWDWFADWVGTNNGIYPNLYSRLPQVPTINLDNRPLINA
jgi:hypothetical protein